MRRKARIDGNHVSIRRYFEAHGCEVESTAQLGNGFPDLVVAWGHRLALVEVKTARGRIREDQRRFLQRFPMTHIVRTDTDAAAVIASLKETQE